MKLNILLIGGGSYIANNFYLRYKNKFNFTAISRKASKDNNFNKIYSYFNKSTLNRYIKNKDIVILAAGFVHKSKFDKHEMLKINVELPTIIYRICNQNNVKKFIFLSSISIYKQHLFGSSMDILHPNPINFYGLTKLNAEKKLKKIEKNTKLIILNLSSVYGEGAPGNMEIFISLINKTKFNIFSNVNVKKSLLNIENLNTILNYVCTNNNLISNKKNLLVSDNKDYSIKEIAALFYEAVNKKEIKLKIPIKFLYFLSIILKKNKIFYNTSFSKNNLILSLCNRSISDYLDNL